MPGTSYEPSTASFRLSPTAKFYADQFEAREQERSFFEELEEYELDTNELLASGFHISAFEEPLVEDTAASIKYLSGDSRVSYPAPPVPIPYTDAVDDLPGYAPDRIDPAVLRAELEEEEDALCAYAHRLEDLDVSEYQRDPEAEMDATTKAQRANDRIEWRADQLKLRKIQLHRAFQTWYGRENYRDGTMVIWVADSSQRKGVRPEEVGVLQWVAYTVAEKQDELKGVSSCLALMRRRLTARTSRGTS